MTLKTCQIINPIKKLEKLENIIVKYYIYIYINIPDHYYE